MAVQVAMNVGASGRAVNRLIAMAVPMLVIVAFMPMVYRAEALDQGFSLSRVIEPVMLAGAALCALTLVSRGTELRFHTSGSGMFVLFAGFGLWAMTTALISPPSMTGLVKGAELIVVGLAALCFSTALTRLGDAVDKRTVERWCACGVLAALSLLIVSNVFLWGSPLPRLPTEGDGRLRLFLGNTHPLEGAMLLSVGIVCILTSDFRLPIKTVLLTAMTVLLLLADARGITIGLAMGIGLITLASIPKSPIKLLLLLTLGAAVIGGLVLTLALIDVERVAANLIGEDLFTLNGRLLVWKYALAIFSEYPLTGVGFFNSRYFLLGEAKFAGHAHNSVIEVLMTTGVIGGTILFCFIGTWFYVLLRTRSLMLLGFTPLFLTEGMLNPVILSPGFAMFFLMTALITAIRRHDFSRSDRAARSRL